MIFDILWLNKLIKIVCIYSMQRPEVSRGTNYARYFSIETTCILHLTTPHMKILTHDVFLSRQVDQHRFWAGSSIINGLILFLFLQIKWGRIISYVQRQIDPQNVMMCSCFLLKLCFIKVGLYAKCVTSAIFLCIKVRFRGTRGSKKIAYFYFDFDEFYSGGT
jgi:hypothetical protein